MVMTLKRPQVLEEQRQSFDTELAALRAKHAEELAVVRAAAKVAAASVSPDGACPSIHHFLLHRSVTCAWNTIVWNNVVQSYLNS